MSNNTREALSALSDNEADELELRRLLRTLESLPAAERAELEATWSRYHLARSVLHDTGRPVSDTLAQQIQARLANEPAHERGRGLQGWQQQLARLAVAASVAVIVVLGVQVGLHPETEPPLADNATPADHTVDAGPASSQVADSGETGLDPESEGLVYDYIRSIVIDPTEPAGFEHIADSPLYRLVNRLQVEED